jgi:hypothetical protein
MVAIQPEILLPSFEVLSTAGQRIRSVEYRQRRNLLLAFLDEPAREEYLGSLCACVAAFRACNAQVLAFLGYGYAAEGICYPFPLVADPERRFWERFGIDASALVMTDQFSSIRKILWVPSTHPLPPVGEVVEWLEFIDLRCHECNIPLW